MKLFILIFLTSFSVIGFSQTTEKSLFWEISGNNLDQKSYLYGTMHVQDDRVFQFSKKVTKALNSVDTYAMEINPDSMNQMSVMNMMWMDGDTSLKDLLSTVEYSLVESYFKDSLDQPIFLFNKILPIMTSQMISMKDFSIDQNEALDIHFSKIAKSASVNIIGLETINEQISALQSIPYSFQGEILYKAVKNEYDQKEEIGVDKLIEVYIDGDLEGLLELTKESDEDPLMNALFQDEMIDSRNNTMTRRIINRLKKESMFIAVGAAHLGGTNGIIQLLRDNGYSVKAIRL